LQSEIAVAAEVHTVDAASLQFRANYTVQPPLKKTTTKKQQQKKQQKKRANNPAI